MHRHRPFEEGSGPGPLGAGPLSPALTARGRAAPAYELKFLLTDTQAREVAERLRGHLDLDPFARHAPGNAYQVTSVYYDTATFDVYRRAPGYRLHKFRLRRYGHEPVLYLERKSKRNGQVRKRRTALFLEELDRFRLGMSGPAQWFAKQLLARHLRPVCRVTYERTAWVGMAGQSVLRVTMDQAPRGLVCADPQVEPVTKGFPLLAGERIVEFKFSTAMPALFNEIIEAMRLMPSGVSKYRRCIEAAGLMSGSTDA